MALLNLPNGQEGRLAEILRGHGCHLDVIESPPAPIVSALRASKDGLSVRINRLNPEPGLPYFAVGVFYRGRDQEFVREILDALRRHGGFDPPKRYVCQRVGAPIAIDGTLRDAAWGPMAWTADFVDITGNRELKPRFCTRVKMGWDDEFLYVGAEMEEPHVWGTITEKNAVIFEDNDFEVFIDPDCDGRDYYEFEVNALGTIWELSLPKPYGEGGVPILGCNLPGLKCAVQVRGTLNDPNDEDEGWSVEVAFPWAGLAKYNPGRATPPRPGDVWKVNFSRVQWRHEIADGTYVRIPPHGTPLAESLNPEEQQHPEDNWVWSPQGAVNMHLPLRWGEVEFR